MDKVIDFKVSNSPVEYPECIGFMEDRCKKICEGKGGELAWFLTHPHIYTGGASAKKEDVLDLSMPIFPSPRGGQYTYHGPGQRIVYIMIDIRRRGMDVRQYMDALHLWIMDGLEQVGVEGSKHEDHIGIWVRKPDQKLYKICAMGVRLYKRQITSHGIALNIFPNLDKYKGIVPCGINDPNLGVTSLKDLGIDISMEDMDRILMEKFPFGELIKR